MKNDVKTVKIERNFAVFNEFICAEVCYTDLCKTCRESMDEHKQHRQKETRFRTGQQKLPGKRVL